MVAMRLFMPCLPPTSQSASAFRRNIVPASSVPAPLTPSATSRAATRRSPDPGFPPAAPRAPCLPSPRTRRRALLTTSAPTSLPKPSRPSRAHPTSTPPPRPPPATRPGESLLHGRKAPLRPTGYASRKTPSCLPASTAPSDRALRAAPSDPAPTSARQRTPPPAHAESPAQSQRAATFPLRTCAIAHRSHPAAPRAPTPCALAPTNPCPPRLTVGRNNRAVPAPLDSRRSTVAPAEIQFAPSPPDRSYPGPESAPTRPWGTRAPSASSASSFCLRRSVPETRRPRLLPHSNAEDARHTSAACARSRRYRFSLIPGFQSRAWLSNVHDSQNCGRLNSVAEPNSVTEVNSVTEMIRIRAPL